MRAPRAPKVGALSKGRSLAPKLKLSAGRESSKAPASSSSRAYKKDVLQDDPSKYADAGFGETGLTGET